MKNHHYILIAAIGLGCLAWLLFPTSPAPGNQNSETPKDVSNPPSKPAPPPLPEKYVTVAKTLAQKLLPSREAFTESAEKGGEGEALARLHEFVLSMKAAQSADEDLNYIAAIAAKGYEDNLASYEALKTLPDSPGFITDLLKAAALNHFGGPVVALKPIVDNLSKRNQREDAQTAALRTQAHAMEKIRAASLLLPRIVERRSPASAASADRFQIDFDESWGGSAPCDWLKVFNEGPDLTNATVRVTLHGQDNDTRENVHFVDYWPGKTWLHTRYDLGRVVLETEVWRTTVTNAATIDVDVWAPAVRWSGVYSYRGAELERDIETICEPLKLSAVYVPYEEGILLDTKSKLTLTMRGVPQLPTTRVIAVFEGETKQKSVTWDIDRWAADSKIELKLENDAVDFVPQRLAIRLEFPPHDAAWAGKLKFK